MLGKKIISNKYEFRLLIVRREQKEKTVPPERSALSFAKGAWPGA
jgi:hypothetical protein